MQIIFLLIPIIVFLLYFIYKKLNNSKKVRKYIINFKAEIKTSQVLNFIESNIVYPLLISSICIITYWSYHKRLKILYYPSSITNIHTSTVYTLVWTVIMVFSVDVAITQIVNDRFSKYTHYMGIPILQFSDNWYFLIHKFITNYIFSIIISYFIIAPIFIFSILRKFRLLSLFYIWQISYLMIMVILILLLLSDFSIIKHIKRIKHYMGSCNKVPEIEKAISYKIRGKFIKDIKSYSPNLKVMKYLKKLLSMTKLYYPKNQEATDSDKKRMNFQINRLISIFSSIIFSTKIFDSVENHSNKYEESIHVNYMDEWENVIESFITFLKCDIQNSLINENDFVYKTISEYISVKSAYLSNLNKSYLNMDNIIKSKYVFPFQFINHKYICKWGNWKYINSLFKNNKFIKKIMKNKNDKLSSFKYSNYQRSPGEEFVCTNIKKLILNEINYLSFEYNKNNYNIFYYGAFKSLESVFPKFFSKYIYSSEFKNGTKLNKSFYKKLIDSCKLPKYKYFKKHGIACFIPHNAF